MSASIQSSRYDVPRPDDQPFIIDQSYLNMHEWYYPEVIEFHRITPDPIWYFIDDEREPVAKIVIHWVIFRDGPAMLAMIRKFGLPQGIAFDHDLGEANYMTGHDVAKAIIEMVLDGTLVVPAGFEYTVHSQNPIGAKNIADTMDDLDRMADRGI